MTYYQRAKDLFGMIETGKLLEALDKYYHEDVVIISEDGTVRSGINQAREYDRNFLKEIQELYGGEILTITSDESRCVTMVEFWINLKFKNGTKRKLEEVAVQQWQDHKIIQERFYASKKNKK